MTAARTIAVLAGAVLANAGLLSGCASLTPDSAPEPGTISEYQHSRYDYWAFRARFGRLPEPNYLPWAAHFEQMLDGEPALIVCRLADRQFPLKYAVPTPVIPEALQDEFKPREPEEYVLAVERAFAHWEEAIGRPVRFRRVERVEDADLVVHLRSEALEEAGGRVLGMLRDEAKRCRVVGPGPTGDTVEIDYDVREAFLFIVDPVGLLTPRQVETVTIHEIGHILGASAQHSPLRGDAMFKIANDRRIESLSEHDVNTFRAIYRIPPGSVYARLNTRHVEPMREIRRQPPRMGDEQRDERYAYQVRFPRGWQVLRSPRGHIAVDGLSWDHDASVQVIAARGNLASFLARQGMRAVGRGELMNSEIIEIDGQSVARLVVDGGAWTEETAVLQWGEGWVLMLIADCRTEDYPLYRPWFTRVLFSIEAHGEMSPVGAKPPTR